MSILISFIGPLRAICMAIDGVLYSLLDNAYNLVIKLSTAELLNHSTIKSLMSNLYVLVGVVAFFRLALLLVNSIIDPEKLNEKGKGLSNIFFRVVGMLILLVVTPMLFQMSYELQGKIVGADTGKNIIFKTLLGDNANIGSSKEGNAGSALQNIALSSLITIDKEYLVNGKQCKIGKENSDCGFYPLTCVSNGDGTCTPQGGYVYGKECDWANCQNAVNVYNEMYVNEDMSPSKLAGYVGVSKKIEINGSDEKQEVYVYNYMFIVTGIVGIAMTYIMFSFAIDIAVRMFELIVLEILSPLFIATFVDPKSAQSGPFKNWLSEVGKSYVSLYIKLAIIALMVLLVSIINQSSIFQNMGNVSGLAKIFMIIGLLIFAKKAPKWIGDMVGIKGDGMGLWTPKKLRENMAFGNTISKGARAAAGLGLGAAASIHAARKANRLNRAANGETIHSRAKQAAKNQKNQGKSLSKQAGAYFSSMFSKNGAKQNWDNMIKGKKDNARAGFGALIGGMKSGVENGWKADNLKDMQGKIKANADATLNTYAPGYKKPSQRVSEKVDKFSQRQMDNVLGDSTTRGKREKDLKDRNTAETNGMLITGADGKRNKIMSPVDSSEVKKLCNGGIKTSDGRAIEFSSTNENGISQALIASRATDIKLDEKGNVTCKLGKDDLVMNLKNGMVDVTRNGQKTTKNASDYAVEGDKIMNANGKMAMESIARENAIEKIVTVNNNEQAIAQANQNMLSANSQIIELKGNIEAKLEEKDKTSFQNAFKELENSFEEINNAQLNYGNIMKKRSELDPKDPNYEEKLNNVMDEIANSSEKLEKANATANAIKETLGSQIGAGQAEVIFSALTSKNNNILQVQRILTETAELKSEINTDIENYGENSYYAPENNDKSGHVNYAAEPGKVEEIIDLMKAKKQKVDDRYKKATEVKSE